MAISMRLNIRQRTAVATATRLPRYARNDKVGTHEVSARVAGEGGWFPAVENPRWLPPAMLGVETGQRKE